MEDKDGVPSWGWLSCHCEHLEGKPADSQKTNKKRGGMRSMSERASKSGDGRRAQAEGPGCRHKQGKLRPQVSSRCPAKEATAQAEAQWLKAAAWEVAAGKEPNAGRRRGRGEGRQGEGSRHVMGQDTTGHPQRAGVGSWSPGKRPGA